MKTTQIVNELKQAAYQLGYEVRVEKGNFRGGRCSIEGESIIMLNKRHLPEAQLAVLADALRDTRIDTIYLKPAVRQALEEAWAHEDEATEEAPHAD
jgi:hypothetical protein